MPGIASSDRDRGSRPRPSALVAVALALVVMTTTGCLWTSATVSHPDPARLAAICAARVKRAVVTAVTPDTALENSWTDYAATGKGWVSGDSVYAYQIPHLGTLNTFSDSFLYTMNDLKKRPIIHNLFVVQSAHGFKTVTGGSSREPTALLTARRGWFYLGFGGIDEGKTFQQFFMEVHWWGPGSFDYSLVRMVLATFSLPSLRLESVKQIAGSHPQIRWGSSVERFGNWDYVYGTANGRLGLGPGYVARVAGADLRVPWSYWDGHGWSSSAAAASPVVHAVQTQYDVTQFDGMYVLVTSDPYPKFSANAHVYFGCSPTGPFDYHQRFALSDYVGPPGAKHWGGHWGDGSVYVYDALAQPALEKPGQFIVSYDQNDILFPAIFQTPSIYRPGYLDLTVRFGPG
ncbi:MAG: hypothetical protein ACLPQS_15025 [Acidimicrobiales bacterium]